MNCVFRGIPAGYSDGKRNDWLEGRGPKLVLMGYIDDATNKVFGRFYDYEGVEPAMDSLEGYIRLVKELRLPESSLYPVTLPLRDAGEGILITLAQMITDKRNLYPKLTGLRVTLEESRLEYHPFVRNNNELIHATRRVSLDRTALTYGIWL